MADDDDDGTTIDTGGGQATGADSDAGGDDWIPPTKAEHEKIQRALAKANAEAKANREKLKALQAETEDATGKAAREQAEAAERKFKPIAVKAAAKAAFLEAGLPSGNADRLARVIRMLDLDAIQVDDDGDVTGLEDQVAGIKRDFPELFGTQEKRPPKLTMGDRQGGNGRQLTSSQIQARQVLGR